MTSTDQSLIYQSTIILYTQMIMRAVPGPQSVNPVHRGGCALSPLGPFYCGRGPTGTLQPTPEDLWATGLWEAVPDFGAHLYVELLWGSIRCRLGLNSWGWMLSGWGISAWMIYFTDVLRFVCVFFFRSFRFLLKILMNVIFFFMFQI